GCLFLAHSASAQSAVDLGPLDGLAMGEGWGTCDVALGHATRLLDQLAASEHRLLAVAAAVGVELVILDGGPELDLLAHFEVLLDQRDVACAKQAVMYEGRELVALQVGAIEVNHSALPAERAACAVDKLSGTSNVGLGDVHG